MFCVNCGNHLNGLAFCSSCGSQNNPTSLAGQQQTPNLSLTHLVIPKARSKQFLHIFGCLVFVVISIVMIAASLAVDEIEPFTQGILFIFGGLGIITFGLFGIVNVIRLFTIKIALQVDANGIIDNSSAIALGFIPWEDVVSISVREFMSEKLIVVEVSDEEKYLRKLSLFKRKLTDNRSWGLGIIQINLNQTQYNPTEISNTMNHLMAMYKRN